MNEHDHPLDPSTSASTSADERIDALARSAGSELRRPAPADGLARAQRARRQKQMTRVGGAGVAAIAILAIGAVAIGGRDAGPTVVPATVSTVETPGTTTPDSTVPDTATPDTATPDTSTPDTEPPTSGSPPETTPSTTPPEAVGPPAAVYTTTDVVSMEGGEMRLVDPLTGEVVSTRPVDAEAARAAQDALLGRSALRGRSMDPDAERGFFTTEYDVGAITYSVDSLPSEYASYEGFPEGALARFDRCAQSAITVTGASATALPARVAWFVISADGRWLVTASAACPEPGTLVDGGEITSTDLTIEVFDATRPDLAGAQLVDALPDAEVSGLTFSPDGRYLAVSTFASGAGFRFFELATATELETFTEGCTATGTRWSRFIGPWIGESSVALQLTCGDDRGLLVRDLVTAEELRVDLPIPADAVTFSVDVDFATYDRPGNVWFTACDVRSTCWIGQGDAPLVELPGQAQASFLPLGFEVGG